LPTEEAVRVALRTQQIIANESGVTDTVDPLGGAHAIEYLTDEIERRAGELIAQIDRMGGAVAAIEAGWMQAQIAEAAYRHQQEVERGERVVVGVNAYQDDGRKTMDDSNAVVHRPSSIVSVESEQQERLRQWRANRDAARVSALMNTLENAARGDDNLMPHFIAAVEGGVTVGEIGKVLRTVFGEYQPVMVI